MNGQNIFEVLIQLDINEKAKILLTSKATSFAYHLTGFLLFYCQQ